MSFAESDDGHYHHQGGNIMHKLLERQLKLHIDPAEVLPKWQAFLQVVNDAYTQFEEEYIMIEHSLDFTSTELMERNQKLTEALNVLKETQNSLVQVEKMAVLGQLVAGVAHEINTPLGISVTASSYLKDKLEHITTLFQTNALKKSELEDFLMNIGETVNLIGANLLRAANLITSFKQTSADQTSEEKRVIRLQEYLTEVVNSLSPALKKTKLKLQINCLTDLSVDTYPGIVFQIVANLVMNSIMHGFEPQEEGHITLTVTDTDTEIIMDYADTGKGIPEQLHKKIFEPFFTTARNKGGIGLGLNIIYNKIVQTLKGNIICQNKATKGANFIITFPKNLKNESVSKCEIVN